MTAEHDCPANRVLGQWKGDLHVELHEAGVVPREVLVTRYGDGSMTVVWRPDQWTSWSPWSTMVEA